MAIYLKLDIVKKHLRVDFDDDDQYIYDLCNLVEELVLTEIQGKAKETEGLVTTDGTITLIGYLCNFLDYTVGDIIIVNGETPRIIATIVTDDSLTTTVAFTTTAANVLYDVYTGMPIIAGDIPISLRHAMLLMVGHFYQIREPALIGVGCTKIPYGYEYLVAPYKNYTIV